MEVQQVPKKAFALMYCQQPWKEIQWIYLDSYLFFLSRFDGGFKIEGLGEEVGARISSTMQRIWRILSHHAKWGILS